MATAVNNNVQAPFDPTSSSATSSAVNGQLGKDDFLNLLVAQLSHQDPMSPTDPSQFVSQLSQFSSLEQLMNVKEGLDLLAVTQTAGTSAQMVSFIGKSVVYEGSEVAWHAGDEPRNVHFQVSEKPATVHVTIRDANGTAVDEYDVIGRNGDNPLTFNGWTHGKDSHELPAGQYAVEIDAKDADGTSLKVSQQASGKVAGVTFEHGYPEIVLDDGTTLALGQIIKVVADVSEGGTPVTVVSDSEDDGAVSSGPQLHFPNASKSREPSSTSTTTLSTPTPHSPR